MCKLIIYYVTAKATSHKMTISNIKIATQWQFSYSNRLKVLQAEYSQFFEDILRSAWHLLQIQTHAAAQAAPLKTTQQCAV